MSAFAKFPERCASRLMPGEPVWIFGVGTFGRSLARACVSQGVVVQGFVQTLPASTAVDGLPVRAWSELSEADCAMAVLVGIFNRGVAFDGLVKLASGSGFQRILLPWDLYAQFGVELGWRYWLADPNLLRSQTANLNRTYDHLADDVSRECFFRLVNFRLGLDLEYSSFRHSETQYFNDLSLALSSGRSITYLDGGAYDGDSYRQIHTVASVARAWLFEPDSSNYSNLVHFVRENDLPGICIPLALSNACGIVRFSSGIGEASHFDETGSNGIATVAIDDLLAGQPVDFIKLDVEGAEELALRGAARTLLKHMPILALSCYHRAEDLWVLLGLVNELSPGYKFYLRQHAYNSFDLVLYCIPT